MVNDKRKIYLVLTYTGTMLAKLIKYYTHSEFSHVSIALDENLEEMYSFGRIYTYFPFLGGYIHENMNKGTYKRFKNTDAEVYILEVSNEQYKKISDIIYAMYKNKELYKFNVIGLFANGLNIKYRQRKNYFYCAEFIEYLFNSADICIDLPNLVKPNDFKNLKTLTLTYKGKLNKYEV